MSWDGLRRWREVDSSEVVIGGYTYKWLLYYVWLRLWNSYVSCRGSKDDPQDPAAATVRLENEEPAACRPAPGGIGCRNVGSSETGTDSELVCLKQAWSAEKGPWSAEGSCNSNKKQKVFKKLEGRKRSRKGSSKRKSSPEFKSVA